MKKSVRVAIQAALPFSFFFPPPPQSIPFQVRRPLSGAAHAQFKLPLSGRQGKSSVPARLSVGGSCATSSPQCRFLAFPRAVPCPSSLSLNQGVAQARYCEAIFSLEASGELACRSAVVVGLGYGVRAGWVECCCRAPTVEKGDQRTGLLLRDGGSGCLTFANFGMCGRSLDAEEECVNERGVFAESRNLFSSLSTARCFLHL